MTRADDPRLGKAAVKAGDEGADLPVPLVEAKTIMQPFGDRSKVVIEPMLTDQWFVDTAKIVDPALDAVRSGRTKILPEAGEKTYFHWLETSSLVHFPSAVVGAPDSGVVWLRPVRPGFQGLRGRWRHRRTGNAELPR